MKKTTAIIMLVIQITFLFVFYNMYALFAQYERVGFNNEDILKQNMKELKVIFGILSVLMGALMFSTGVYLVFLFRKAKNEGPEENYPVIDPLHNYLLQLKTSENLLKDKVQDQQESVTKKDELNKNIINNIDAGIIFVDDSDRIEIFNAAAQEIFNRTFVTAINRCLIDTLEGFPEIIDFIETNRENAITTEIESSGRIFNIHVAPINHIGLLIIARDVSEERKREEIARRNDNFIMLGNMTVFLAHEVRNSLGVILGYTKTIKSEKEKTGRINKELQFLTEMMESFLNFSKPVTIQKKEPIDLKSMLTDIAAEQNVILDINTEITDGSSDETGNYILFENDPVLIHAIFSNLLLNSIEAGADKTTVTIKQNKDLVFFFSDNGNGIPDDVREKIWYPFFTTKDKGTGMGLASIRKIINSLNGDITLERSDGEGTVFKIVFYG